MLWMRWLRGGIAGGLVAVGMVRPAAGFDLGKVPTELVVRPGWEMEAPARVVVGRELFQLIDGGAELYREFGFSRAYSAQLKGPQRGEIQVEIYEMSDAAAACGVFSLMQSPKGQPLALGQGGLSFDYYLQFWKGPYYVSVTGSQPRSDIRQAVREIAEQIEHTLTDTGSPPTAYGALPDAGLQERKFVKGRIALSNIYSGGLGELFPIGPSAIGQYPGAQLFLLGQPSPEAAQQALAEANEKVVQNTVFHSGTRSGDGFSCEDDAGKRIVGWRRGNCVVVIVYTDEVQCRRLEKELGRENHTSAQGISP